MSKSVATPQKVYVCGECNRVVAVVRADGTLDLRVRHDREYHHTIIPRSDCQLDKL